MKVNSDTLTICWAIISTALCIAMAICGGFLLLAGFYGHFVAELSHGLLLLWCGILLMCGSILGLIVAKLVLARYQRKHYSETSK
ncbi:MAG: hypothetical protein FWG38_00350 [Defluviitaleaceae bacterium]|nr:hypothetical protein [Defluviitaleaceae bacterium]